MYSRFAAVWTDRDRIIASCVNPMFKLDWIRGKTQKAEAKRYVLEELRKHEKEYVEAQEALSPDPKSIIPNKNEFESFFNFEVKCII